MLSSNFSSSKNTKGCKNTRLAINQRSELKSFDKEIYALGGLDSGNYKEAIKAGASGVCFMSLAMNGDIELIKKIVKSKNG